MRIIVLGPPNSGKSTFLASLEAELKALGVQAERVELDLASPTAGMISQGASAEEIQGRAKRPWTQTLAEAAAVKFLDAQADVVLGDAPGKIDAITETIARPADAAIILVRSDRLDVLEEWRGFAQRMNLEVIAELNSVRAGESVLDMTTIPPSGQVSGLDRKVLSGDDTIVGVAQHMLELSQEAHKHGRADSTGPGWPT